MSAVRVLPLVLLSMLAACGRQQVGLEFHRENPRCHRHQREAEGAHGRGRAVGGLSEVEQVLALGVVELQGAG